MITLVGTNILGTVLGVVTIFVTTWRLWYRKHTHKLWWDDLWAALALGFSIWPWIFSWVIFQPPANNHVAQRTRAVCTYILAVTFELAIWSARLSILWTVIRIAATRQARRPLYFLAGIFITFALILSAQKFWVCVPQPGWLDVPGGFCNFGKQVAITEIVTDIIGDALLIIIPIRMLWRAHITQSLRIRLICIFSMSILTTTASLAQNYYQIHDGGVIDNVVSHVELQVAVTVCNLNVIGAAFYRWRYRKNLDENDAKSAANGLGRDIVTIGGTHHQTGSRSAQSQNASRYPHSVQVDTVTWSDGPLGVKSGSYDVGHHPYTYKHDAESGDVSLNEYNPRSNFINFKGEDKN